MATWLQKIARSGALAASNQFLGANSMSTPQAGPGAAPKLPGAVGGAQTKMQIPAAGASLGAAALSQNTGTTLGQETITHGDSQAKANTAPIIPGMIHPTHPNPNAGLT